MCGEARNSLMLTNQATRMKKVTMIRWLASLGALGSVGCAGYVYMVVGIRETYFPNESNGYLFAIIAALCLLAVYFVVAMGRGYFVWLTQKPK